MLAPLLAAAALAILYAAPQLPHCHYLYEPPRKLRMVVSRSLLLLLLLPATCVSAAASSTFKVAVSIGGVCAYTDPTSLTSVTMDVCLAKQRFPFDDPTLLALSKHLGGGGSILRIGGSDQNSFYYDTSPSTKLEPFSNSTGGHCCPEQHGAGGCHGCAHDCTMPAAYWKQMVGFAQRSGHRLMFGLVPDVDQARALLVHSAREHLPVWAYTYGNEQDSPQISAGYPVLRQLINNRSVFPVAKAAPRLAGPDVALQRHATIDEAWDNADETIAKKLKWVNEFVAATGKTLDVVSWHTYDFHASDIGMEDHTTLQLQPETARLWSTRYVDLAARLSHNVSAIAAQLAPHAEVWLSETDSICHQGVNGVTNAYINSLWLVNRLGLMATRNVTVMARQSLIGYNYSLLGNWPAEPMRPNPDYFTTILFRRLFGGTVLAASADTQPLPHDPVTGGGARARAFAFCANPASNTSARVALALINFDPNATARFEFDSELLPGPRLDFVLTPGGAPVVSGAAWSSRTVRLNGELLRMGGADGGELPPALSELGGRGARRSGPGQPLELPPLTLAFALFPAATAPACM